MGHGGPGGARANKFRREGLVPPVVFAALPWTCSQPGTWGNVVSSLAPGLQGKPQGHTVAHPGSPRRTAAIL